MNRKETTGDSSGSVDNLSIVRGSVRSVFDGLGLQDNTTTDLTSAVFPIFDFFGNALSSSDSLEVQKDVNRNGTDRLFAYDGLSIQHDRSIVVDVGDTLNITSGYRVGDGTTPWADLDGALELLGVWNGLEIRPIYEVFRPNVTPS